ncbi:unnamed protein product [Brassica oleracea]
MISPKPISSKCSSCIVKSYQTRTTTTRKHAFPDCKISALAVSSDDRYLATRGVDRHVHIWDVHTREHVHVHIKSNFCFVVSSVKSQLFMIMCLQAFTGHRNTISSL